MASNLVLELAPQTTFISNPKRVGGDHGTAIYFANSMLSRRDLSNEAPSTASPAPKA
jgi:hypothetical protein